MIKVDIGKTKELFALISENQSLYLPIEMGGQLDFRKYSEGARVRLDKLITAKSPKGLFFPQSEGIVSFKREGKKIHMDSRDEETDEFVIFGVRACDEKAMRLLDLVFLADPVDTFYASKRERGTIVTLSCAAPHETCFCEIFSIDATMPEGDVRAYMTEKNIYFEALTKRGESFLKLISPIASDADEGDLEEIESQRAVTKEILKKLPLGDLNLSKFTPERLLEKFDSPLWEPLSESCLGCGSCTFVCPTCQCYDICDYDTGGEVKRFRCWDSCMYSDFTLMAHGNPRKSQLERFRQRFMHKLMYFPENNGGEFLCVGCGRCLTKCPVSMNIAKVIRRLGEDEV